MIRFLKIVLAIMIFLWSGLGVATNFGDINITYASVAEVTRMPMFPANQAPPWRTESPIVNWAGVTLIILGKLGVAALAAIGVFRMCRAFNGSAQAFQASKSFSIAAGLLSAIWLFFGFTIIGETVFMMFLDPKGLQAGESAFRYGGFIALFVLLLAQPDGDTA